MAEVQIFVRGLQRTHTLRLPKASPTVDDLKRALVEVEGLNPAEQVLFYGGVPLEDGFQLNDVPPLATIELSSRLLGGKVHGSLARAGKVKGQTPKVEPQEKKKKKTGRAKRRIQYNRRFVNVVAGVGGRRRGPNSNTK